MVELLLEEGDDPGQRCVDGKTPLHYAAQMGHEAVATRLLAAAPEKLVNATDSADWTPLHCAAECGSLPLVAAFLEVAG